jgi:hypothetical protein
VAPDKLGLSGVPQTLARMRSMPPIKIGRFTRMSQKERIMIFGIPIICLLVAIAIPNFARSRVVTAKNSCINQLRQIDGAKVQWAFAHHKLANDAPTWEDLRSYFIRARLPLECPDGGVYTIGRVDELPSCSIARHTEYWRTNHP